MLETTTKHHYLGTSLTAIVQKAFATLTPRENRAILGAFSELKMKERKVAISIGKQAVNSTVQNVHNNIINRRRKTG